MIEKLTECAKAEMDKKGIEELDAEEFSKVTDMLKDLSEAMYYRTITVAMEESEYGEDYDYEGRKGYRGQRRDSRGRYMSNRGRRGYESRMMPDMDWDDMEYQRDIDRNSHNRMYYTDGNMGGSSSSGMNNSSMGSQGGSRGYSESRYDRARRGYEESKAMHKGNTAEDKQQKMKELENYMKELSTDVTDMISDMSPEEKSLMKQKMQVLMQKIQ